MKSTMRMSRRSMLGGLLTAGAVAAFPEGITHAGTIGGIGTRSLSTASAATAGLHYERFSAISFLPFNGGSTYVGVSGGIKYTGNPQMFVCPFAPAHGSRLKELEFYVEPGTASPGSPTQVFLVRFAIDGTANPLAYGYVNPAPGVHTATTALDHVVDIVNFDYELWVNFHSSGTFRGARVASILPTGLITVPQIRKLDTRSGAKPVVGSVATVDLAPDIPPGARAALVTITATGTANSGFVTAFPGDQSTAPDTSSLNWTASNIDIATTTVVSLGAGTSIKLAIGGPAGAATHLLVDALGYFI